jgi:ATP-binding cassette subfamily B protein
MSRKIKPMQENIVSKNSELTGSATESLRNIELVKSLGLADQQIDSLSKDNYNLLDLEMDKIRLTRKIGFIQGTMINAIRCLMIIVLLYLIYNNQVSAGEFFTFLLYSMFLFNPFQDLGKVLQAGREAGVSLERLKTIISKPFEHVPDNPKPVEKITRIRFEDVVFEYENHKGGVKNISFEVKSGESIAFVGPSGSGKSTIIKLLVRLYSPSGGSIYYNTNTSKDLNKDDIRKKVGIVTQDTQLFSGTIRDNLLFVRPGSNDEECMAVLKQAACVQLIEKNGVSLSTRLGEGGMKVSGGERQRLAIARALLRKPDIVIFDEATSALDSITEKEITKTIQDIAKAGQQITIMVAHRLSTIKFANKIYVLKDGTVAETGTHDELLDTDGLYASMWKQQVGEAI